MFARMSWSRLPQGSSVDDAISNIRNRILPSLKTQEAYLGVAVLGNRETGEGVTASYWLTRDAMAASEAMGDAARAESAQATGASVAEVDRFELVLNDRAAIGKVGSAVRVNDVVSPLGQVDAALAFVRDAGVSAARQLAGYQATRVWLNRESGRVVTSTSWETAADREASEAVMGQLRRQVGEMAHLERPVRVSLYELLLLELSPAMEEAVAAAARAQ